jgi:hypothetical protein
MHYIRQQPRKGTALREVDQDVLPEIKVFQEGERSAYDGEVVVTDHDFHSMKHRSGDGLVLVPYMYSPFDHSALERWTESIPAEYGDGTVCFGDTLGLAKYMR